MDGWMKQLKEGWTDRQTDEWINGWMDEERKQRADGWKTVQWTDGWMNEKMNKWLKMARWKDGGTDGQTRG